MTNDTNGVLRVQGRLSYPSLYKPTGYLAQTPRYSATILIPKDDAQINTIWEYIKAAVEKQWPKEAKRILENLRREKGFAFQDGDLKDPTRYPEYQGMMALKCINRTQPRIVDQNADPLPDGPEAPYAGCYVRVNVMFNGFQKDNNINLFANLMGLQFVADGPRLGGTKVSGPEDFEKIEQPKGEGDTHGEFEEI